MNRKDNWQTLLMPVSEGFHNRVEETLEQIGKEVKSLQGHRKRTRAVRSLAVALVAALLLAGTALAVGRLAGILDFASPRVEMKRHANILNTTSPPRKTDAYASLCAKDITMAKWRAPF